MEQNEKPGFLGWKAILAVLILLLIVVFSVQNSTETPISFLIWEGYTPLVMLMLFSFILGLGFALLAIWPMRKNSNRKSKLIKDLELRIETLENQIRTNTNKTVE